ITAYKWTQTSGPSTAALATPTQTQTTASGLLAGTYIFQLTVTDKAGATASDKMNVVVNPPVITTPPPPTWQPIPGTIQAESYSDMKGVTSENTLDAGGGKDLGILDQGDEVSYNVDVAQSGAYSLSMRVATPFTGAQFKLETSSGYVLVTADLPNTGSAQAWSTLNLRVNLPEGKQTLKLVSETKFGWNFNWMQFSFVSASTVNNIPGLIQAEEYDNTVGSSLETSLDSGGGDDATMDKDDQMNYRVNVKASGNYTARFRVASADGSSFKLMDGTGKILAVVPVPSTGGSQVWQTVSATVTLTEGDQQTLVIQSSGSSPWNINWMQFGTEVDSGIQTSQGSTKPSIDSPAVINIYPNPVVSQTTLDIASSYTGRVDVQVINASGTIVRHYVLTKGLPDMQAPISLSGLAAGMYVIRVQGLGWGATRKILKK
ncbi:MAG TPA: carbohydrate-binding protein, partial [Puia sp.]